MRPLRRPAKASRACGRHRWLHARVRRRMLAAVQGLVGAGRTSTLVSVGVLLASGLLQGGRAWAQSSTLPANALPTQPKVTYGTVDIPTNKAGQLAGQITQTSATGIVSWKTFDIGKDARVSVVQPSSSSVLLNKAEGGAIMNRTTIDGLLEGNGRVYIYNPNGIVFGKTANINVNTLIASTLKFDESRVIGGLLQSGTVPVLGADASLGGQPGDILVDGNALQRASISAGNGGLVLLAAPTVNNKGVISAPDGQVILAAGSKVYLAAPNSAQTGTSLRGLLVEVSNDYEAGALGAGTDASIGTSLAQNATTGRISVGRGNATMIGYAVNQNGLVSATTSVNLNGSVYLLARDEAVRGGDGYYAAKRTGSLTLGPDSQTVVLPDLTDTSTIGRTGTFTKSDIQLNGQNIQLQDRAQVLAPGGNVAIKAQRLLADPTGVPAVDPKVDLVRVDFAPGSVVDVSGMTGTQLAMESNVITVDLRGTELADNPVLRDSPLYASKVNIDIRKGTSAANVSGWLDLVQRGLGEVNTAGGTVNVSADGAIIQRAGSKIAVDGGYVDYKAGYVNTSKLQLGNTVVDIGAATSGTPYTAVVNLPNSNGNFEAGYRQGADAGTVSFSAPVVVMQGNLSGKATSGERQRVVGGSGLTAVPLGGRLQIGTVSASTVDLTTGRARVKSADQFGFDGFLRVGGTATQKAKPPAVDGVFDDAVPDQLLLASQLDLDTTALAQAGFSRIQAVSARNIEVVAPVSLAPGGQLWLGSAQRGLREGEDVVPAGGSVKVSAPITIPGGSIAIASSNDVSVLPGVALDVAGRWVNDQGTSGAALDAAGNPIGPVVLAGGRVDISSTAVSVGSAVSVDVSAGAWLSGKGQTTTGSAGGIVLEAVLPDASIPTGATLALGSGLSFSGYGFGSGGSLKLVGRNVSLGAAPAGDPKDLILGASFFQQGGFTKYDIAANSNMEVVAGTLIQPRAQRWVLAADASARASGRMAVVGTPTLLPLSSAGATRTAADLTLRAKANLVATAGRIRLGVGSQIDLDPGGNLSLLAGRQLTVLGGLNAPAGRIQLGLVTGDTYFANRSIWFGSGAVVSAAGSTARLFTGTGGVTTGEILNGGSIQIGGAPTTASDGSPALGTADAYVVALPGSRFNVSGAADSGLVLKAGNGQTAPTSVGSNGGSIDIRASEGLLFAGTLAGGSGGSGSVGGSLSVALDSPTQHGYESVLNITAKNSVTPLIPFGIAPESNLVFLKKGDGVGADSFWVLYGTQSLNASARYEGEGFMLASAFSDGNFGRITLKSKDTLAFGLGTSDLSLSARESLVLDAPTLRADRLSKKTDPVGVTVTGKTLTLNAPEVRIGATDPQYQYFYPSSVSGTDPSQRVAKIGNGTLVVNASTIDLAGNSVLQGFRKAAFSAQQDIRLTGMSYSDQNGLFDGSLRGSFSMVGSLRLTDAQTYPTTLSDFKLVVGSNSAEADSGTLIFAPNTNAPGTVLSAGGSLTAYATNIVQLGRVEAPFGNIQLGNTDKKIDPILTAAVTYGAGSVTSVAGDTVVPFGSVLDGSVPTASTWQYILGDGTPVNFLQNAVPGGVLFAERDLPAKKVTTLAASINLDAAASIRLTGGGSLYAYGFTPGKGGSRDVLANTGGAGTATNYAINPNYNNKFAPIDGDFGRSGTPALGTSVYLSGVPGLPAGLYTLLPAHYALLPGGFSISVATNRRDMAASENTTLADGSLLVSGRWAQSGSGNVSTRTQGFVVASGAVVRKKSEFADYSADSYFAAKATAKGIAAPELPADGGRIVFSATGIASRDLRLSGKVDLTAAAGGRPGQADISAAQIEIVSTPLEGTGNGAAVAADVVNAWGADSLVIGAVRSDNGTLSTLNVAATDVSFSNNAAHALKVPELVVAATQSITVQGGATITSDAAPVRAPLALAISGDGAVLRTSGGAAVDVQRTGQTFVGGTLTIADGAKVSATGSMALDATKLATVQAPLSVGNGGALAVSAPNIALGGNVDADGDSHDGQSYFGASAVASWSSLSDLSLNAYNTAIRFYGPTALGGPNTQRISLAGAGLLRDGSDTAASTRVTASTVRLRGAPSPDLGDAVDSGTGSFAVQAQRIEVGSNAMAIGGYAGASLKATGQLVATGTAGGLTVDGDLAMVAGRFTVANGADAGFVASGALALSSPAPAAGSSAFGAPGLGGQLSFAGQTVVSSAQVVAPGGVISMAAAQSLDITGGTLSTAGTSIQFADTVAYAPGGQIRLEGPQVRLGTDAVADVSAIGAAAGQLTVVATDAQGQGQAQLLGSLRGSAAPGADGAAQPQAQFNLDTDSAGASGAFGALNVRLNAGGFAQGRQFRFRQGDVTLAGNDSIVAHDVSIAADNGSITVTDSARIDASGDKGGSIELLAGQAAAAGGSGRITLAGNAQLIARGLGVPQGDAGSVGQGGRVQLGTSNADGQDANSVSGGASVALLGGTIDVAGATTQRNGVVNIRAPRVGTGAGPDVAVASWATDIRNSSATTIEANRVYSATLISEQADGNGNLDATLTGQMASEAAGLAANRAAIAARLGWTGAPDDPKLQAGIEVRSAGDLKVSVNEFAANAADRGWNLNAWRFDGQPIALTLRAGGNLNIVGSISDGFVKPDASGLNLAMPDWALASDNSARLRLVAGADFKAAAPLAVQGSSGDVLITFADRSPTSAAPVTRTDAPVAMVRTGTGAVEVAAARDVRLDMAKFFRQTSNDEFIDNPAIYDALNLDGTYKVSVYGAALYTAGKKVAESSLDFGAPTNSLNVHYGAAAGTMSSASFADSGGAIRIGAGRDVVGARNLGGDWFYRNNDGVAADPGDPTAKPVVPPTPAQPGTKVALPKAVPQNTDNWLFRQGRSYVDATGKTVFETLADGSTLNTAWWARADYFDQGIATLGGGDIAVTAGRHVADLALSAPTSGYATAPGVVVQRGGGDITVRTGADVQGGSIYVQKGVANVQAAGSVTSGSYVPAQSNSGAALNPILALGDAQVSISAGRSLALETTYNPTLTEQSVNNVVAGDNAFNPLSEGGSADRWNPNNQDSVSQDYRSKYAQFSNFSTYGADSAVRLTALGGGIKLSGDTQAVAVAGANDVPGQLGSKFQTLYGLQAPNLTATALSGNTLIANGFALAAASSGQLQLLASGSVDITTGSGGSVRMLDNDPSTVSSAAAPRVLTPADLAVVQGTQVGLAAHTLGGLHSADSAPARIVALTGDILGDKTAIASVSLPKQAVISAGRDIVDLGFVIQNLNPGDITTVTAGRDILVSTQNRGSAGSASEVAQVVGGPGRIDLRAGRNIDLGNGSGVVTRGNLGNPYLADGGASIRALAGAGNANYPGFVDFATAYGSVYAVSSSPTSLTAADRADLLTFMAAVRPQLAANITDANVLTYFRTLSPAEQQPFLDAHTAAADILALVNFVRSRLPTFDLASNAETTWAAFRSLTVADQDTYLAAHAAVANRLADRASTLAAAAAAGDVASLDATFFTSLVETGKSTNLKPFDALIASLFPQAATSKGGDISNFASQFKTEQGGAITLFAPAGSVYAGLTSGVSTKAASNQGIFTIRGGAISSLVKNDFLVNAGRVFTLAGGDITLVSQEANIDAGKGAKTATSAPPPLITVDPNGNIKVDVANSISGSGIATLKTRADQPNANVYAVAPRGIFDAGDAGVRSSGSVDIVAPIVRNADNIVAGGSISGANVGVAAPVLSPITAPANATPKADDAAKSLASAQSGSSNNALSVEVIGLGAAPAAGEEDLSEEEKKKRKANQPKGPNT